MREDVIRLVFTKFFDRARDLGIFVAEDRRGKQRRIGRAGIADGERSNRNTGGHLHDG